MACNVVKNIDGSVSQVYANNGSPSNLFNDLVSRLGSKEEAHKVWLETQTKAFKNKFEDVLDENGEPYIESVESVMETLPKPEVDIYKQQETDPIIEDANKELNERMKDFLLEFGFTTKVVDSLTDRAGNNISGVAKLDTLLKTVQVVRGKANITTLPEEASHLFVELLKAKDSPLYQSMLRSIDKYDMLKKVTNEYSSNPLYQNEDGSPNESKLRDEAIGKLIAAEVVNAHSAAESKPNISRFGRWFQKVLNAIKKFFGGENNPFLAAAENMLLESKTAYKEAVEEIGDVEMLQQEETNETETPQEKVTNSLKEDHENLVIKEWIQEEDGKLPRQLEVIKEFSEGKKLKRYKFTKNGVEYIISNRVTDKGTRDFVRQKGKQKALEISNLERSQHLRKNGIRIHNAAQQLMNFYGGKSDLIDVIDVDGVGTKTLEQIRAEANMTRRHFEIFKTGVRNHIKQIEIQQKKIGEGKANLLTELRIVNPHSKMAGLEGVAGTIDAAVVYSDASMDLLDWKTISPSSYYTDKGKIDKNPFRQKMDSYNTQISTYMNMLQEVHKVEKFNRTRIIPIHVEFAKTVAKNFTNNLVKFEMAHTNPEFLRSIAVALEKTDYEELDELVNKLDNQIKRLKTQQRNIKAKRTDFAKLQARIEILEDGMQELVVKGDIKSLIDKVAQRISLVTSGVGIQDVNHPDYLDENDLKSIYEDFVLFKGITDKTIKYFDDKLKNSKNKEEARNYQDAFNAASTIVNNNLQRVRDAWMQKITTKAQRDDIDLSETPKTKGWFSRNFTTMDVFPHPAFRAAYKKIYQSFNKTKAVTDGIYEEIQDITFGPKDKNGKRDGGLNKWAKDNGMTLTEAFRDVLIEETKNEKDETIFKTLVPMFSKDFRDQIKTKQEKGDEVWMKENFKIKEGARRKFNEMRKNMIAREEFLHPDLREYNDKGKLVVKPSKNMAIRKANIKRWDEKYNVFDPLYGKAWLNQYWGMFLEPKNPQDNYSEKFKRIAANKPVLDYYNKYRETIENMSNKANINIGPNFIANVKDDMMESLLNNGLGFKGMNEMADALSRSFMIKEETETMGVFNYNNDGSMISQIPLPYLNDLTNSHGEVAAGMKSTDLSKSLYLLATSLYNHKHMGEIESYVMGLKEMVIERGEAVTKKGQLQYQGSEIRKQDASPELLATYDKFINFYLYGQRIQDEDSTMLGISKIKTIKTLQSIYSAKVLGFAVIPGIAARITGGFNAFYNGIDGVHYNNKQLNVARKAFIQLGTDQNKAWHALVQYIDPFQSGLTWQKARDLSAKASNKWLDLNNWYAPLRNPDENIDGMITVAMAQNHGIDKEGVLQRLVDLPAGTKSLWESFSKNHKEGNLIIEGLTQSSYEDFRLRVKAMARKIKGEMSDENITAFSTSLTGQIMMQFKSWMPGVVESRFGDRKYNDVLKVLEEGRYWGFLKGLGTGSHGKTLLREELGFKTILQGSLQKGLDAITQLAFLNKFITDPAEKAKLEKEGKWTDAMEKRFKSRTKAAETEFERWKRNQTDKRLQNIPFKEFLRMRQRSVKRTLAEIRALLGMYIAAMAMGMGVGPDDEKFKNKTWLNRKMYMLLSRTQMELGFTLNPVEFATFTRGLIPLTGLFTDSMKVLDNGWTESLEMLSIIPENKRDKTPMFYHTLKFVPGWSQLRRILEVYDQDKNNPYVTRI